MSAFQSLQSKSAYLLCIDTQKGTSIVFVPKYMYVYHVSTGI